MTKFVDGPAVDVVLGLRRAPLFLRAVRSAVGAWDALDQLTDTPAADETIVAYRLVGKSWTVHVDAREWRGWYTGGEYRVVAAQPPDDVLRSTKLWREWCFQQTALPLGAGAEAAP